MHRAATLRIPLPEHSLATRISDTMHPPPPSTPCSTGAAPFFRYRRPRTSFAVHPHARSCRWRGKSRPSAPPPPLVKADGSPLLLSSDAGAAEWAAMSAGNKPAGDGDDDDDHLVARVIDEDVDAEDVHADGTMVNDERGAGELRATGCEAVNAKAGQETNEAAIPAVFNQMDSGRVCRILDNFFLCDKDG